MKTHVCLNMIVKNEAHVIERCLNSAKPYIDSVCITDTGSTDDTVCTILRWCSTQGIPAKVLDMPWEDFATNRSKAIEEAKSWIPEDTENWLLFIDADEVFGTDCKFRELIEDHRGPGTMFDAYNLNVKFSNLTYARTALVRASMPWRYMSVLHEYLTCDKPFVIAPDGTDTFPTGTIVVNTDGARSKDPLKYQKDAQLLKEALVNEPNNPRYVYYLAQSYKDIGHLSEAVTYYSQRAAMPNTWEEEAWHAQYQSAYLQAVLSAPNSVNKIHLLILAFERRPTRVEPLVKALRLLNASNAHRTVVSLCSMYVHNITVYRGLPVPTGDKLFIETDDYRWKLHDEYALAMFYMGNKQVAKSIWSDMPNDIPDQDRTRIKTNLSYC